MRVIADVLRDPVLAGLAVVALLVSAWFLLGSGPPAVRVSAFRLMQVVLDVIFVTGTLRLVRSGRLNPDARRFWLFIGVAGFCFTAADVFQASLALTEPAFPAAEGNVGPLLLVTLGVIVVLWALVRYPARTQTRERLRWWLDAATIMVGAAAVMWYALWTVSSAATLTRIFIAVFTAAVMLVSAFGLVHLLMGQNPPFSRGVGVAGGISGGWIAVGTVVAVIAPVSTDASLGAYLALRLAPQFLLAATPWIQQVQLRADPQLLIRRAGPPYSRLPYLVVLATQLLLVWVLLREGLSVRAWGMLVAAMLATGLVATRQVIAVADNERLLAQRDQAVRRLHGEEHRFRSLVQHSSDITIVANPDLMISYASPASDRVLGLPPDDLHGKGLRSRVHPEDLPTLDRLAAQLIATPDRTRTAQVRVRHADGSWRWLEVVGTNLIDDSSVAGIVCNMRDVTDSHELQRRLRYQATHDALTKLPNRTLLDERTRTDLPGGPDPADVVAILVLDLDTFKAVNDTFGHRVGDGLLAIVAARLLRCVRPVDTVARLGGDEFAVMLPGASAEDARRVASRIRRVLTEPVDVEGHRVTAQASIGITVGRMSNMEALLRSSDEAMYKAKRTGEGIVLGDATVGIISEEKPTKRPA